MEDTLHGHGMNDELLKPKRISNIESNRTDHGNGEITESRNTYQWERRTEEGGKPSVHSVRLFTKTRVKYSITRTISFVKQRQKEIG